MSLHPNLTALINKAFQIFDQSLEYLLLSFFIASAGLMLPSDKDTRKESISYFISAMLLGTTSGVIATNTPFLTDFDYLLACLGTISGPATYALIRRKTLIDILNLYKKAKEGKLEDKDGSES